MKQSKITFYVDIVSPFGYIGYWMLRNSATFKDTKVTLVPILLGGLHNLCGIQAPIFIKNKDQWINKERYRWAEIFKLPLREDAPNGFPVRTVNAMRALTALQMDGIDGEEFAKVVDVLWAALWGGNGDKAIGKIKELRKDGEFDIKTPEGLIALIGSVVGEEQAKKAVGRIGDKDVKGRLVKNTSDAFEVGAFGIPWFQCTNSKEEEEGFWGFDHLGQVVRFFGLDEEGDRGRSGQLLKPML